MITDKLDAPFSNTFAPKNVAVLFEKSPNLKVIAYEDIYKGTAMFSIREIWLDYNGCWAPGKGLTIAARRKQELLDAIVEYAKACTPEQVS